MPFLLAVFSALTAGFGFILAPRLWREKNNQNANRWLAVLVLSITILNIQEIYFNSPLALLVPEPACLLDWLIFLVGPFGFQYVRLLTGGRSSPGLVWVLHGLQAVVCMAVLVFGFYLQPHQVKVEMLRQNRTNSPGFDLFDWLDLLAAVQNFIYIAVSAWLVKGYRMRLKKLLQESYIDAMRLTWLTKLIFILFLLVLCEALSVTTSLQFFNWVSYLAPTLGVYALGYMGLDQPEIFTSDVILPKQTAFEELSATRKFYSCFISHSTKDQKFIDRLYVDLTGEGVPCRYKPFTSGVKFRAETHRLIAQCDKTLIVLSKNSIQSQWVEDEVEAALEKERHQKMLVLLLIRLDNEVSGSTAGWPASLRRTRHIEDFSGRSNADYSQAFARLLQALKK